MKHFFPAPLSDTPRSIMRRIGYGETPGYKGQISYTRRLQGPQFPRFHAYLDDKDGGMQVNLHLDQKAPSYRGTKAHGGEYEGPLVEQEMNRIIQAVASLSKPPTTSHQPQTTKPKKGFFGFFK